jgi:hypothetical protein
VALYNADEQLRRKMAAVEFKRLAKAYLGAIALSFKEKDKVKLDGAWATKQNVAKGVIKL